MAVSGLNGRGRRIEVRDVSPALIDDLINVCSKDRVNHPIHAEGARIKRDWLTEVVRAIGPMAKIAYLDGKPAAQMMFYPEDAGPRLPGRRDVLVLFCVFTGSSEDRGRGLASALMASFLDQVRTKKLKVMAGRRVRFVRAPIFETGEGLSMAELYRRYGFADSPAGVNEMFLEVQGKYEPPPGQGADSERDTKRRRLLPVGRALVFYTPHCQWSYFFADQMAGIIRRQSPNHEILFVDAWRDPAAGDWPGVEAVVDGIPIRHHVSEGDGFRDAVADALKGR